MTGTMLRPLVATMLLALAAPAFAQPAYSNAKLSIGTTGIDLSTEKGRKMLDRRVDNAVNRICGDPVLGSRDEADALEACRSEVMAEIQPQIQAMLLRASAPGSDNN